MKMVCDLTVKEKIFKIWIGHLDNVQIDNEFLYIIELNPDGTLPSINFYTFDGQHAGHIENDQPSNYEI